MQTNSNHFYLSKLVLINFATFDKEEIDFSKGLSAIVGETGSGKSLLLDALEIVLGSKADKKFIRKDCDTAILEAHFYCDSTFVAESLNQLGHPVMDNTITIKRLIYTNSPTKNYLNNLSCPVTVLAQFSKQFVDLVGQFENQKLLSSDYQLTLLDRYGQLTKLQEDFAQHFSHYQESLVAIKHRQEALSEFQKREDYLRFQISELDKLSPDPEEEERLMKQKTILQNRSKIADTLSGLSTLLDEGENSVLTQVKRAKGLYNSGSSFLPESIGSHLDEVLSRVSDLSYLISKESDLTLNSTDELGLDGVMSRLDKYQKIKRKFGDTMDKVLVEYQSMKNEIACGEKLSSEIFQMQKQLKEEHDLLMKKAEALHVQREKHAQSLSKKLSEEIQLLNMKDASVDFHLETTKELTSRGISQLHLNAETNKGEGHYLLKNIASGGELSRILLALRKIIASVDQVSIFLFDEIDTGIGGKTAISIGKSLQDISRSSQVLAITHLPQIAQFASTIVAVSKLEIKQQGRTKSVAEIIHTKTGIDKFISEMNDLRIKDE